MSFLVAVTLLEEYCMEFADMLWLNFSSERIVAHVPLVLF